jgi:hypothetical protein
MHVLMGTQNISDDARDENSGVTASGASRSAMAVFRAG